MGVARWLAAFGVLMIVSPALAAPDWTIVAPQSQLTFTATQSGAPAKGAFGRFAGTIAFDPDALETARIDITVDMTGVTGSYDSLADTLKGDTWFAAAAFPQARYISTAIVKAPEGGYKAEGTLTLRGVSAPVELAFDFSEFGPKAGAPDTLRAVAKGSATLMRTAFGVGQGEWSDTGVVKDAVRVDFTITAERTAP